MRKIFYLLICFLLLISVCDLYAGDVFDFARTKGKLKYVKQLKYNQEGTVTLVRSHDTDFVMIDPNGNNVDIATLKGNQTCTLIHDKISLSYRFLRKRKRALFFDVEEKYKGVGIGDLPQSKEGVIRVKQYRR